MWKNVFIESCIISALVFGGFYINAHYMKGEIASSGDKMMKENLPPTHVSGNATQESIRTPLRQHVSGAPAEPGATSSESTSYPDPEVQAQHISGLASQLTPDQPAK